MAISLFGRKTKPPTAHPPIPDWFVGSTPEWAIYWALTILKVGFTYQSPQMGGRLAKGGAILDFEIPSLNLAINVTSKYWHYRTTPGRMADELQRATLEGRGIRVIFIDEMDALRNPIFYTREALKFRDHSVFGRA